jgi:hypothetical protein
MCEGLSKKTLKKNTKSKIKKKQNKLKNKYFTHHQYQAVMALIMLKHSSLSYIFDRAMEVQLSLIQTTPSHNTIFIVAQFWSFINACMRISPLQKRTITRGSM